MNLAFADQKQIGTTAAMPYDPLYVDALGHMASTIHKFEKLVPPPKIVSLPFGEVYRYVEKSPQQALVLKSARVVTGLHALRLLLEHGLFQEQGSIQRILDELNEDIAFISYGIINDDLTELHQRFLDAFFEEEFDQATAMESTQRRPMIPRTKIQAALAQFESRAIDPSRGKKLSRTIQKTYSGYVHAAAAHIMDLYGGEPPHFHVNGMLGTEREDDHRYDSWNNFYRGILSFSLIYAAFGDMESFERIRAYADNFAKQSCRNVSM